MSGAERYRERRSALSAPLVALGGVLPALLVAAAVALGIVAAPAWFVLVPVVPLAPPFLIYISLLMRNRRTGIVLDDAGLTVGALGAARGCIRSRGPRSPRRGSRPVRGWSTP
ncbi:hypothetical protein ACFQ9X_03845 [Catenulispora yoronensis]